MTVQVILKNDVPSVGNRGDCVAVSRGFARNYLLPRGFAVIATPGEKKRIEVERAAMQKKVEKELERVSEIKELLTKKGISVRHKATEKGKLYGAVTQKDVVSAIYETYGVLLAEDAVQLKETKAIGSYPITVLLKTFGAVPMKMKIVADV